MCSVLNETGIKIRMSFSMDLADPWDAVSKGSERLRLVASGTRLDSVRQFDGTRRMEL